MTSWRNFSLEKLEREYSPSSCVDSVDECLADYRELSRLSEKEALCVKNVSYGITENEVLDIFPSLKLDSPLLVFIHGGYWQQLSKEDSTFAGAALLERNIGYAAIDYMIAPGATIENMIEQCTRSIIWLANNAERYGCSSQKIYLSGSSAGAHLVVMALLKLKNYEPHIMVQGIILLSGIYDLEPIINTYINQSLGLNLDRAKNLSPMSHDLSGLPPAIICWGEKETYEFKRQSKSFAKAYQKFGNEADNFELLGYNHFDNIRVLENLIVEDSRFFLNVQN